MLIGYRKRLSIVSTCQISFEYNPTKKAKNPEEKKKITIIQQYTVYGEVKEGRRVPVE